MNMQSCDKVMSINITVSTEVAGHVIELVLLSSLTCFTMVYGFLALHTFLSSLLICKDKYATAMPTSAYNSTPVWS